MLIKEFRLRELADFDWKVIDFANPTIVYSKINSTGKTTLLRAILYCLGFSIPNTELVKFEKYEFQLLVTRDKDYHICRKSNFLTINEQEFDLPTDTSVAHAIIFGTSNPELLNNVLGTIYFDQEKGWTLLNRGTIIGVNRFGIESFFRGLKGDESIESYEIVAQISSIDKKIAQYNLMLNVAEYQEAVKEKTSSSMDYETYDQSIIIQLDDYKLQLTMVEDEIARINTIIKSNKNFLDYLEQKRIFVENPIDGQPIQVTKTNLLDYCDLEDINISRRTVLIAERNSLKKKIAQLNSQRESQMTFREIPSIDEELSARLSAIQGVNSLEISRMKEDLQKQRTQLNEVLINKTKTNNPWIAKAYDIIKKYAEQLEIPFDYKIDIFTRNLKAKSGAILHKMVFVYKLAYIKLLSECLGYPIPIICDSPSGREVEEKTIHKMLRILHTDFSNHQLIIASIFKFDDIFSNAKIVELDGTLFNKKSISD